LNLYSVTPGTSTRSGLPYVTCRAFLSQGKDPASGALRPAKWFTLKAFCTPEHPENPAVYRFLVLQGEKNVRVHLTGKLEYREWSNNGRSGTDDIIIVDQLIETSLDPEPNSPEEELFAGEPTK
jgi:hypothetical protein